MKVYAYIPLHYGSEYLYYSIKSFEPLVEKIIILYSKYPSFGSNTTLRNPDNEDQLKEIAYSASNKIEWVRVTEKQEGLHRGIHRRYFNECDIMFTSDADEVWWTDKLEEAIKVVSDDKQHKSFGVQGKVDLWRSFNWQMIDWFAPVRFTKNRGQGQRNIDCPYLHFGYAQTMPVIEYKMSIHGHMGDIRSVHGSPDKYLEKIRNWKPGQENYFHPASKDIWEKAEPYDKQKMPDLMKGHPFYDLEII